jgi:hypothetical protein
VAWHGNRLAGSVAGHLSPAHGRWKIEPRPIQFKPDALPLSISVDNLPASVHHRVLSAIATDIDPFDAVRDYDFFGRLVGASGETRKTIADRVIESERGHDRNTATQGFAVERFKQVADELLIASGVNIRYACV